MKQTMRAFALILAAISFPINLCVSFLDSRHTSIHMVTYIDVYYSMHIGTQTQFLFTEMGITIMLKNMLPVGFLKTIQLTLEQQGV